MAPRRAAFRSAPERARPRPPAAGIRSHRRHPTSRPTSCRARTPNPSRRQAGADDDHQGVRGGSGPRSQDIGQAGAIARFPTKAHFASYTGTAPIEVSSGEVVRHRLSRAGNRKLNHVVHMIAICQARHDTEGRAYYRRKLAEGKSEKEALRCLKRRISDAVYKQLRADLAVAIPAAA